MKGLGRKSKEIMVPSQQMLLQASFASERLIQLISIFDYHIAAQKQALLSETKPSFRDSQSLARTVMSLNMNLDKYTKMLHPPTFLTVGNEESLSDSLAMAYAEQTAVPASLEDEQSQPFLDSISKPEETANSLESLCVLLPQKETMPFENPISDTVSISNPGHDDSLELFQEEDSQSPLQPKATIRSRISEPLTKLVDSKRPWLKARYTLQTMENTVSETIFQDEKSEKTSEPAQSEPLEALQAGEWDTEDEDFPFHEVHQQAPPNTEGWWYKHAT
jgi:hypothetical protein